MSVKAQGTQKWFSVLYWEQNTREKHASSAEVKSKKGGGARPRSRLCLVYEVRAGSCQCCGGVHGCCWRDHISVVANHINQLAEKGNGVVLWLQYRVHSYLLGQITISCTQLSTRPDYNIVYTAIYSARLQYRVHSYLLGQITISCTQLSTRPDYNLVYTAIYSATLTHSW